MKRVNVMISDEAKKVILLHQERNKFTTLDESLDSFILKHKDN